MVYIIAEIGINHNGDVLIAEELIRLAASAGCNAVKFQKRTPELCVPKDQWSKERDTPWGVMSYIDYKKKIEFGEEEFERIFGLCEQLNIDCFASPWDTVSVDFLKKFPVPYMKVASASITDLTLLEAIVDSGVPIMMSTGMSTLAEIDNAWGIVANSTYALLHTNSSYPCPADQANLAVMDTLRERYRCRVGYSGHETGLQVSLAAVARGAEVLERHITLDRTMWGTDHAASLEPRGLLSLVRDVRLIEAAIGDGTKEVWPGEVEPRKRLRGA